MITMNSVFKPPLKPSTKVIILLCSDLNMQSLKMLCWIMLIMCCSSNLVYMVYNRIVATVRASLSVVSGANY